MIIIPPDSQLNNWIDSLSITEIPYSYQVVSGMATVGACLQRWVYVDQKRWQIYPKLSVLFIGPSGAGKDTVINQVESTLKRVQGPPIVQAATPEMLAYQLSMLGDPSWAVLPIRELANVLGKKDYQSGYVQLLTDLLSDGDSVDVSTKSSGVRHIQHPTLSLLAGSTVEWLHNETPTGTLEGGFFPRCLIICEDYSNRFIPLIKDIPKAELNKADVGQAKFEHHINCLQQQYYAKSFEFIIDDEAKAYYANWYHNRNSYFSPMVRPYAHRSRDQILRLGMLSGLLRSHNYIDRIDMHFAASIIQYIATRIDKAIIPPTKDAEVSKAVLTVLPMPTSEILKTLVGKYQKRQVTDALSFLIESKQIRLNEVTKYLEAIKESH